MLEMTPPLQAVEGTGLFSMFLQGSVSQSYREQLPLLYPLEKCPYFLLFDGNDLHARLQQTDGSLLPIFDHFYRTHVHMGSDHWVALSS